MFLTKEAVRLGLPDHAQVVACDGCPPLSWEWVGEDSATVFSY
jgi:hypothetical protein